MNPHLILGPLWGDEFIPAGGISGQSVQSESGGKVLQEQLHATGVSILVDRRELPLVVHLFQRSVLQDVQIVQLHVRDGQVVADPCSFDDLFISFARASKDQVNSQIHRRVSGNFMYGFQRRLGRVAPSHELQLIVEKALHAQLHCHEGLFVILLPQIQDSLRQAVGTGSDSEAFDPWIGKSHIKVMAKGRDFRERVGVGLEIDQESLGIVFVADNPMILLNLRPQLHRKAFGIGGRTPDVTENTGLHSLQSPAVRAVIHDRDRHLVNLFSKEFIVVLTDCMIGNACPAFFHRVFIKFILREVNKMKTWNDIGFEIEITGDGSPSLRLLQSVDVTKEKGESMHHSGGACSETLMIYGEPIGRVFEKVQKPHFLVVGLGLGYIEMVIAREALKRGKSFSDVGLITSYESVPELREFFFQWLHGREDLLNPEVVATYESVLNHVLGGTSLTGSDVKHFLKQHFKTLPDISGPLSSDVQLVSKYHCVLYDAFSSKTSPHLWEEDFLNHLLQTGTNSQSLLTTYACKGSLKRALKSQGFEIVLREGFQGKRNSTLGLRNI